MSSAETAEESVEGFEFEIETARLEQALENMRSMVHECVWSFSETGVFLGAVDPANVGMVHQTIGADAFEFYHATDMDIGLNLDRLDDYLGELQGETVTLSWDAEKGQASIEGDEATINMAGIDPDTIRNSGENPDIKDDLPVALTVEAGAVDHAVGLAEMVSEHLEFDTDPDREVPFHIYAEGDTDDVDIEINRAVSSADYGADATTLFSIEYLVDLFGTIPTETEVFLRHGTEFPTTIEWSFAEGAADVTMMVAPRIQN